MAGIVLGASQLQGGGSGASLQGGSTSGAIKIQGSSPTLQSGNGASMILQPAASSGILLNPGSSSAKAVSNVTPSATTPSYDPAAAAAAAAAAQKAAQAASLKTSIQKLIGNIHSVYDTIYGSAQAQAQDKSNQIATNFGNQEDDLTKTLNSDIGTSNNNFAARGTGDSSYHSDNLQSLNDNFNENQQQLEDEKNSDLADVGSALQATQQGVQADEGNLNDILGRIQTSTDPDELQTVLDTVQQQMATLQSGQSQYNTQAQSIAAAPVASNNLSSLESSLNNIVAGTAPSALKLSVGTKLIQSAGLTPDQQQTAIQQLQTALAGSDGTDPTKQNTTATTTGQ